MGLSNSNSFKYTEQLLKLSVPIIFGQMGQMLVVAGDVYIATMHSTEAVASIGIAAGFINPIFLFGIGLMMGISPIMSQRRGRGVDDRKGLFSIIIYGLVVGIGISLATIVLVNFTGFFGVEEKLIPAMNQYMVVVSWSFPFAIIFQGVKEFLQSFEKVFIANLISIISVILNLGLNYIFVFGYEGFSGYGEVGLAYASVAIRIILCLTILIYARKYIDFKVFSLRFITNNFKFGFPVAFMFFVEVLGFCTVSILSGRLGGVAAAANNIIMTISSVAFMVPLALSSASGVKIGHSFGMQDKKSVSGFIKASLIIVGMYVMVSASAFFVFPVEIMTFMSQDNEVIELGVKLLFLVAFFQLADGFQVVLSGILRGLEDTKTSFKMVFIGYWVVGIPCGYYLCFYKGFGTQGLWMGLALSLFLVAFLLSLVTYRKFSILVLNSK